MLLPVPLTPRNAYPRPSQSVTEECISRVLRVAEAIAYISIDALSRAKRRFPGPEHKASFPLRIPLSVKSLATVGREFSGAIPMHQPPSAQRSISSLGKPSASVW